MNFDISDFYCALSLLISIYYGIKLFESLTRGDNDD